MADEKVEIKNIDDLFVDGGIEEGSLMMVSWGPKKTSGHYDPGLSDEKFLCLRSEVVGKFGPILLGMAYVGYTSSGAEYKIPYNAIREVRLTPLIKKDGVANLGFESAVTYHFNSEGELQYAK